MAKLRLSYPTFRLPEVTSGAGALRTLGDVARLEDVVLMVSGQPAVSSLLDEALARAGQVPDASRWCRKPPGEPTRRTVEAGAAFLAGQRPSSIVAVGGGSVLDWARLSWAVAEGLLDLDRGAIATEIRHTRPRFVLVPTTCASGAEAATVAVYTDGERKRPVISPMFLADRVILDGRFLKSLDAVSFASSASDALSHAAESVLSIVPNGLAKMTAGAALRTLLELGTDGVPSASRADRLMEASYLAGAAASHTSVGIAHAFAHAMAIETLSHGAGNSVALGAALRFNADAPAMAPLLAVAGCDAGTLLEKVRSIAAPARQASADLVRTVIRTPSRRQGLVERMLADVALRSNPLTVDESGVHAFLDLVEHEVQR